MTTENAYHARALPLDASYSTLLSAFNYHQRTRLGRCGPSQAPSIGFIGIIRKIHTAHCFEQSVLLIEAFSPFVLYNKYSLN